MSSKCKGNSEVYSLILGKFNIVMVPYTFKLMCSLTQGTFMTLFMHGVIFVFAQNSKFTAINKFTTFKRRINPFVSQ